MQCLKTERRRLGVKFSRVGGGVLDVHVEGKKIQKGV